MSVPIYIPKLHYPDPHDVRGQMLLKPPMGTSRMWVRCLRGSMEGQLRILSLSLPVCVSDADADLSKVTAAPRQKGELTND